MINQNQIIQNILINIDYKLNEINNNLKLLTNSINNEKKDDSNELKKYNESYTSDKYII